MVGARHDQAIGCLKDFRWDKTAINAALRAAFLCDSCKDDTNPSLLDTEVPGIERLLNDISMASRGGVDLASFWADSAGAADVFDVFLCHTSVDKPAVRQVAAELRARGVSPWLDEEQIVAGDIWQEVLEDQIASVRSVAVFVGETGIGPWADAELRAFLVEFRSRGCRVIPVLLSNVSNPPTLPIFLRNHHYVDLRRGMTDGVDELVRGIRR